MSNGDNSVVRNFFGSVTPLQVAGVIIGVLAIGAIAWFIFSGSEPPADGQSESVLTSSNMMRGVITFSVAIVTVAIALTLVLYVIMGNAGEDFKDRFTFGKDILMVFIGILGTIMGYYYAEDRFTAEDVKKVQAAATDQAETAAAADFERHALAALLNKNYENAVKAFADAFKVAPTRNNVDAINKLLVSKKTAFAEAGDDSAKQDAIWKEIFCEISEKSLTAGMSKEMIAQIKNLCGGNGSKPAGTPAANSSTNSQ